LVLAVIGSNKSGKTSTIEFLIPKLKERGLSVSSAKHVHHPNFTIDVEGKDTWRHMKSGSDQVVCLSQDEVAIIRKQKRNHYDIKKLLNLFNDGKPDLIILEGFHWLVSKNRDVVKIVTANNKEDVSKRLVGVFPQIIAITGRISNLGIKGSIQGIPVINLKENGEELLKMVLQRLK
jgi:molybdopterin-guanine dinucleotide biosynthesis protein B